MAKLFLKHKQKSVIEEVLTEKKPRLDDCIGNFKISFQYFVTHQKFGSTFLDWQKREILAHAMEVLQGYCHRPLFEQVDGKKFTIYGDFPATDKTKFTYPVNVPEDANWARIHASGLTVIAGHIIQDTFYVVFLDPGHKFFLTSRITGN